MPLLWRDELETGVAGVDEDHRNLFRRASDFFSACDEGRGSAEIVHLLSYLDDYAGAHFRREERLQEAISYSRSSEHRQAHREFRDRLLEVKRRFLREGASAALIEEVNVSLVGWLLDHIAIMDAALGEEASRVRATLH